MISKKYFSLFAFLLFCMQAHSYQSEVDEVITNQVNEAVSSVTANDTAYKNEILKRLELYRKRVEDSSYEKTLKLCEGYRRVSKLGPHPYHGRYLLSKEQAFFEWFKLIKEGAIQPLSAIGGLKADYLDAANTPILSLRYWFQSLYSAYFINSLGFTAGAMHCLGLKFSDGSRKINSEINKLASMIMIVDYEASLLTHAAMTFTGTKLLSFMAKGTRWLFSPVRKIISLVNRKLTLLKNKIKVIIYTSAGILIDNLGVYFERREVQKQVFFDTIVTKDERTDTRALKRRFVLLYSFFEQLRSDQKQSGLNEKDNLIISENFILMLEKNLNMKTFEQMELDHRLLSLSNSETNLSEFEKNYSLLLSEFLPVLSEIYKNL